MGEKWNRTQVHKFAWSKLEQWRVYAIGPKGKVQGRTKSILSPHKSFVSFRSQREILILFVEKNLHPSLTKAPSPSGEGSYGEM